MTLKRAIKVIQGLSIFTKYASLLMHILLDKNSFNKECLST